MAHREYQSIDITTESDLTSPAPVHHRRVIICDTHEGTIDLTLPAAPSVSRVETLVRGYVEKINPYANIDDLLSPSDIY